MTDVTSWVTHATREPGDDMLESLHQHWSRSVQRAAHEASCPWLASGVHGFALAHVDRATHKRRLPTLHLAAGTCDVGDHGPTPMSAVVPTDMFAPQQLRVEHTGELSPLAVAIDTVKAHPTLLATCVITEQQFTDVQKCDQHSSASIRPDSHGVVLPFMYVDRDSDTLEAGTDREDLLRAHGFASYVLEADPGAVDILDIHRSMASLMEDLLDEIAQIKADAVARVLIQSPLWPMVVIRGPREWGDW